MSVSIISAPHVGAAVTVARADLAACLHRIHDGALQEVATLRVALSVWAHAAEGGDTATARTMVLEVRAATDRLLDELSAIEQTGRGWLDSPDSN